MVQKHDNTKSTHCHDVGALSFLVNGKECNVVLKLIPIVLGHFVNPTVPKLVRDMKMTNHIYFCQIITCVDLRAAMFFLPSHKAADCFTICRETMQAANVYRTMHKASWDVEQTRNRPPFWPKQWVKHNTNCIKKELSFYWQKHRCKSEIVSNQKENLIVSNNV